MKTSLKTKTHVVPAKGSVTVDSVGNLLYCLSSTGGNKDITLTYGNNSNNYFEAGTKYKFDDQYYNFTLTNNSDVNIKVELAQGSGDIEISNSVNVDNIVKVTSTSGGIKSSADAVIDIVAGQILAENFDRKEVILVALSTNTADVRISGADVAIDVGTPLAPGQSAKLTTTSTIHAITSIAGQKVSITEFE